MSLLVEFADPSLGRECNCARSIDQRWGEAARDVMASLDVLATSADVVSYEELPNVSHEGECTVFKGSIAEVVLELAPRKGPPPAVTVTQIDVRGRSGLV